MPAIDRDRLAKLLGLAGSAHDAEVAAARKAHQMLTAAGLTWRQVMEPFDELQVAIAAAQRLIEENDALRARVAVASAPASDRRTVDANPSAGARWALALAEAGAISLSEFEHDFLGTVAGWRGELTRKQAPVFDCILGEVCERARRVRR